MSVFDKLLDSIKLNDDDYDEDNYLDEDLMDDEEGDFFDDDPMDDKPKKKFFEKFGRITKTCLKKPELLKHPRHWKISWMCARS